MSEALRLQVVHETAYRYSTRVELAYHSAVLRPAQTERQILEAFELEIDPLPSETSTCADVFGNTQDFFSFFAAHEHLGVRASSRVVLMPRPAPPDPEASPPWEGVRESCRYRVGAELVSAAEFSFASPFVPRLAALGDYARSSYLPGRPALEAALDLMRRIHLDFAYDKESTDVSTPLAQVFEQRRGVCQDFAHVAIGCLRALGLPAAYVSGYLLTQPAAAERELQGADASHAWLRVWCPANGWVDLDPTNDRVVDSSHVTVAVGRDYGDVMPVRGVIRGGGDHGLGVAVSVTRV